MSGWSEIYSQIAEFGLIQTRTKALNDLSVLTGRCAISYYSGWLQRPRPERNAFHLGINDEDKNLFMNAVYGLDTSRGLDLILHSPGGEVDATESLIHYLRSKFGQNIRTIVPQIAMSGGTMLAFLGRTVMMARHSNLGPIDPQHGDMAMNDILSDFDRMAGQVLENPQAELIWRSRVSMYPMGYETYCRQALAQARHIGEKALETGMFAGKADGGEQARAVVNHFMATEVNLTHGRHIHRETCQESGLAVDEIEADQALQDAIMTVHHANMISFHVSNSVKTVENSEGRSISISG